jgi:hypothetical protein
MTPFEWQRFPENQGIGSNGIPGGQGVAGSNPVSPIDKEIPDHKAVSNGRKIGVKAGFGPKSVP